MARWWKTEKYSTKIEPVEVAKSTEMCIWIGSRRSAKHSDYDSYFPTWAEARDSIVERESQRLEWAQKDLARCEKSLAEINAMQEPEA